MEEVVINGVLYVPKTDEKPKDLRRCIVRTYSDGVHIADVDYDNAPFLNCTLYNCERLYKWGGKALALENLAEYGTNDPSSCRICKPVPEKKVNRAIGFIPISKVAMKSLDKVERE